jgi:phosphate transport system substrate-binding protein
MRTNLIFFVALILCGCNRINRDPYTNTPTTGRIKVYIDETFKPVGDAEIQVFEGLYRYSEIIPVYLPESNVFDGLLKDSTNVAIASRTLNTGERDYFGSKKLFPRELKIAVDAVAVIVHPENQDTVLTVASLKDVLTGKINRWDEIYPGSTLGEMSIVFDNEKSSIVHYMMDSIIEGNNLSKNLSALDLNTDVITYVSEHREAVGLIGVSWISDRDDTLQLSFLKKIRVMALSKESIATYQNSYQPFQAYMHDGSYPLIRNIYAINTEPRNGLATGFVSFLSSDKGQRIILKAGILPANSPVRVVKVRNEM